MFLVVPEAPPVCRILRAKLALPFPVLSDPRGDSLTRPLGLWDETSNAPISATVVLGGNGRVLARFPSVDWTPASVEELAAALPSMSGETKVGGPVAAIR